jgi:hypothetical protein
MAKFKTGDQVICNGNRESYVLDYYTDDIITVRLWSGQRWVGDVCEHEDDLILQEVANDSVSR